MTGRSTTPHAKSYPDDIRLKALKISGIGLVGGARSGALIHGGEPMLERLDFDDAPKIPPSLKDARNV